MGWTASYGHPVNGTEDALETLSRKDIVDFFLSDYRPEAATLVVVGDISLEEVARLAEERLGGWRAQGHSADITVDVSNGAGRPPPVCTLWTNRGPPNR